jgi:hypothetical protein
MLDDKSHSPLHTAPLDGTLQFGLWWMNILMSMSLNTCCWMETFDVDHIGDEPHSPVHLSMEP